MADTEVVVVRAHRLGQPFWAQYERLVADLGQPRVFLMWDVTHGPVPPQVQAFHAACQTHVIEIDEATCKAMTPFHVNMYTECESLLVHIADRLDAVCPDWARMWLIEYDVACAGNWAATLAKAAHCTADLLATYVEHWTPHNHWGWGRLQGALQPLARTPQEWKAFIPAMRLSRRAVDGSIKPSLGKASGYCESYFSTLLVRDGYSVGNLPPDMLGNFTCHCVPRHEWERCDTGADDRLWHAVKIV